MLGFFSAFVSYKGRKMKLQRRYRERDRVIRSAISALKSAAKRTDKRGIEKRFFLQKTYTLFLSLWVEEEATAIGILSSFS